MAKSLRPPLKMNGFSNFFLSGNRACIRNYFDCINHLLDGCRHFTVVYRSIHMILLCVFLSGLTIIMGKKASLPEVKRTQIGILQKEGYSERQIGSRLKCSKTAVHTALQDCCAYCPREFKELWRIFR